MNKVKTHIAILFLLLMVYIPVNNILYYVLVNHHNEISINDTDENINPYEFHHSCKDFVFKLSYFTYYFYNDVGFKIAVFNTKIFQKYTFLIITSHDFAYALRGPPHLGF